MSIDFGFLFTHVPGNYDTTLLLALLLTLRRDSCTIDCAVVLSDTDTGLEDG